MITDKIGWRKVLLQIEYKITVQISKMIWKNMQSRCIFSQKNYLILYAHQYSRILLKQKKNRLLSITNIKAAILQGCAYS